jgi:ribosomal protein S18 acetylase RimI-like enzyme
MNVRKAEDEDIEAFVVMANATGWSYEAADAERLLRLFPDGFFACDADGKPAGFATALGFGQAGIVGNVVVDSRLRKHGLGRALTEACVGHLKAAGATEIRLYAYENVVGFYEKLGFRPGGGFLTMKGQASPACRGHGAVAVDDALAKRIVSSDRRLAGCDRARLLKSLRGEFPELALASADGESLDGYILARGSARTGYEAGPWVAEAPGGEALLDALMERVEAGSDIWVTVPEGNKGAMAAVKRLGFKKAFRTVEMSLGAAPRPLGRPVFALCGLEKG